MREGPLNIINHYPIILLVKPRKETVGTTGRDGVSELKELVLTFSQFLGELGDSEGYGQMHCLLHSGG